MGIPIGTDMRVIVLGADLSSRTDLAALALYKGIGANVIVIDDIEHFPPERTPDWRRAIAKMSNGRGGIVSHTANPKVVSKRKARRLRGKARA